MFECQLVPGTYPDVAGNTDYLILLVKGAPSQGIVVLPALNFLSIVASVRPHRRVRGSVMK